MAEKVEPVVLAALRLVTKDSVAGRGQGASFALWA
jgi:hypothetical protein